MIMQTSAIATFQPDSETKRCLVNELPPEILGEIFQAYTSSTSEDSMWEESNVLSTPSGDSPLILGQICRYWRDVALGMRTLWSSIFVECPTPDHTELVRLWLERAGSCPLTLVLRDWCDSGRRECSEGTEAIMQLFVGKAESWRNIDFVLEFRDPQALDALQGCPKLESARVSARYLDEDAMNAFWTKLHGSPALRQVNWHDRSFERGLPHHAPWAQLQSISTHSVLSDAELLFILHACPDLQSMEVRYYTGHSSSPLCLTSRQITHDRLQNLTLHITSSIVPVLDNIILPSLQSLHLKSGCDSLIAANAAVTIGRHIEDLLTRSRCRLRRLELSSFKGIQNFHRLLQHLLCLSTTRSLLSFNMDPVELEAKDLEKLRTHLLKRI